MPYKSKAQSRMFHYLQSKGKLPKKTVEEFDENTDYSEIPEQMWSGGMTGDPDGDQPAYTPEEEEDEVYGNFHPYNSSGDPGTEDKTEYEHPMSYMSKGGMVDHLNKGDKKPKRSLQGGIIRGAFMRAIARSRGMK